MKLATAFSLLLLHLAAVVIATPVDNTTAPFHLRTAIHDGYDQRFNDLYPYSFHTGAGTSAVTFGPSPGIASYFNDTRLNVDLGEFVWGYHFSFVPYAPWYPVTLDAAYGPGTEGFTMATWGKEKEVLYGNIDWIVCEWWYGVMLFRFRGADATGTSLPASCARVRLVVEWL